METLSATPMNAQVQFTVVPVELNCSAEGQECAFFVGEQVFYTKHGDELVSRRFIAHCTKGESQFPRVCTRYQPRLKLVQ